MRVRWTRGAVADLFEIGDFIARDNPTAASRVLQSIRDQVRSLRNQPQIGRLGRIEGTRELVHPRYPFSFSAEVFHVQATTLDDALQCTNGNGFPAVHSDNDLPAVGVTPFLMTA